MLRDEDIRKKIDSFPQWHYEFNLRGNLTPIFDKSHRLRHHQREKYFFDPLVELLGGSLAGKRVLDLGCNAGFWSLHSIKSDCEFVLGIDGRKMHVDQANFVFEVEKVEKSRYEFVEGNIFDLSFEEFGNFDVVLCLGLMYHISKHMVLMEQISSVNSDVLVIDTLLSPISGPYLELRRESMEDPRDSLDYELVMVPTEEAIHDLVRQFRYSAATLKPRFRNAKGMNDYRGAADYRDGIRRAFICTKTTDLTQLSAEVERFS